MGGWVGGWVGGWPGSDNKTISVQLDLTWTGTGTELGNKDEKYKIDYSKKLFLVTVYFFDYSLREAFIRKKTEIYWSFTNMGVPPPPFRGIGNFRFFPRVFSSFFRNFKMIIYAP